MRLHQAERGNPVLGNIVILPPGNKTVLRSMMFFFPFCRLV